MKNQVINPHYERVLVRKLKTASRRFTRYMQDMANYNFDYEQIKSCLVDSLVDMGRIEAFAESLMCYDNSKVPFCKKLTKRANDMIIKANN